MSPALAQSCMRGFVGKPQRAKAATAACCVAAGSAEASPQV